MKRLWSGLMARVNQLRHGRARAGIDPQRGPQRGSASSPVPAPPKSPRTTPAKVPTRVAPKRSSTVPIKPPAPLPTQSSSPPPGRHLDYAPQKDGRADPGEIVWTWVPYEEDPKQGKDRPVLVVGREGGILLGLMLSSQHDRDGQHNWYALGAGDWDRADRPSWVRLDRVLRVAEDGIRREGAILDRTRFGGVAKALRAGYGWR